MEDVTARVSQALEQLKAEIQQNLSAKGINASGKTSASLQVEKYEDGVRLVAVGEHAPMSTLEIGHDGKGVPQGFTKIIYKWSQDKGIAFATTRERWSFSYLTARKIANEGTIRHREPSAREDVYSSAIERAKETLSKDIELYIVETLKNNFENGTKQ